MTASEYKYQRIRFATYNRQMWVITAKSCDNRSYEGIPDKSGKGSLILTIIQSLHK